MKPHIEALSRIGACLSALDFAETYDTAQAAWDACPRGDWLLWLIGKDCGSVGSPARLKLVGVCSAIAREALSIYERRCPNDPRVRTCLDTLDRYAAGGATLEEVSAADAAAADAARSAYAARSASAAWSAADAAAWSAADAAYARVSMQKKTADIVRQHYPICPTL